METDKIKRALQERFAAPLPDGYRRRILFWYDPEGDFAPLVDEVCPDGVRLLKLTETNNFSSKMLLADTDTENHYLVYHPLACARSKDDWLLDIELYSEAFRADLTSMRMQNLRMEETPSLRGAVKRYAKFFENKDRVARLTNLGSHYTTAEQLETDILAVLAESANTEVDILRAVLSAGLDMETNGALLQIRKFGHEAAWWELVARYTGFAGDGAQTSLLPLAAHILMTALSATMPTAALRGLEVWISLSHQRQCHALVHEWRDMESLYDIAREVEEQLRLAAHFDKLDVSALLDSDCFPCIDECILRRYMTEISEDVVKVKEIFDVVERRRTLRWYQRVRYCFDGVLQAARMKQFYQAHSEGFHTAQYPQLWKTYCDDLYRMDSYYRLFHAAFGRSLNESGTVLDDLYRNVADFVERLYKDWFLGSLDQLWNRLTRDALTESGTLDELVQQTDFYRHFVQPLLNASRRVYVIISDALRYETAADLKEQLIQETKGNADISAMQALLPSVTRFGMAALLPHRALQLSGDGNVLCDGLPTAGTENREKVLQTAHEGNVAIAYKALLAMKQAERREKLGPAKVVYIYHNAIDAAGDKAVTEDQVFEACEQAIREIKNLVRLICNDMSAAHILITSDHGFLYTYKPLEASDKLAQDVPQGDILQLERRFALAKAGASSAYMLNLPMPRLHSDCRLLVPQGMQRIQKSGGGMKYVHGGTSLQEMVVPVIEYRHIRTSSKQYEEVRPAGLQLISQGRKVSSNYFALDFYQPQPIGGKVVAARYDIYMTDARGQAVSDRQTIIADKDSRNEQERSFRVRLMLKGLAFSRTESYYLVIAEQGNPASAERVEFTIDVAFTNDFDF